MALESATNISDLVTTNPTAGDPKSQGDDHLRLLKTVLKNSVPDFTYESTLASASTCDIGGVPSSFVQITGTTGITSFGTNYKGPKFIRFAGALTLTHNASTLILPGGASITTAAGDTCIVVPKATSGTSDGWVVVSYDHAPAPAFSVHQSAGQSLTSGSITKIQFQTKDFDTNGFFDNATNYRFQPTVAGYYQLEGTVGVPTGLAVVSIYKNGAEFKRGQQYSTTALGIGGNVSALVLLNGSTDYVEIWGLQLSGSPQTTNTGALTHFSGFLSRFP